MKKSQSSWIYPIVGITIVLFLLLLFQMSLVVAQNISGGIQSGANKNVHLHAVAIDHKLVQIAKELPGFGGMFFDETGDLNIYLTPSSVLEYRKDPGIWNDKAKAALTKVFEKDLLRRAVSAHQDATGKSIKDVRILVREGKYEVGELMQWRPSVENALNIKGVVLTDLDETRNRLRVGIEKEGIREDVMLELLFQGVPLDAVIIEPVMPGESFTAIYDRTEML